ncbi:MAG: DNA integrity scanning protein DisA nucleotide-binding domain protein, partial [Oscillospiraceae bacterium]|nr:DNA integrity scanning protein DisA nucleotide-binding domain protein [Oscillospiraceae bacterium]
SRHRAAIGMSENSDAIIIVVSEETGQISVAENGVLVRDFTRFKLNEYLHEAILPKPVDMKKKLPVKKGFRFKGDGKK